MAATIGKVGALISTFLLPFVLFAIGKAAMLSFVAAACFIGAGLTYVMGIETKQLSLEDVSEIFSSFYDTFDKISSNVLAAAEAFNSTLKKVHSGGETFDSKRLASEIKLLEHNGDELVHDAFTKLAKKFIAPIDRQDISSLLKALDDVLDFIDATASRMQVFHIELITKEMVQFSDLVLGQTKAIREAILALKAAKAQVVINQAAIKMDELENEADTLLRDTLGSMFEEGNESRESTFNIMKLKEIYEYLESTTDEAEDVADVLRNLIIKYSL
jgi:predicted phosphate transport protein (TIGR00153 family)